ncbi:MAG: 5-carboxymethyl-2-hydroxymuconate isomerase [Desulfobacteraceae bacterium 4572_88]|nr:MAG: 5-carboxymethyl-2-hydroxymuconate isomerase [Desulfobacteraceae bacterium 4572_88]
MRIIRFSDENNEQHFGHHYKDDSAILLEGELFGELRDTGKEISVKKLLAPLQPAVIFCIGLNYHEHADETGMESPKYPVVFMKNPAAAAHPGDPIILPRSCLDPPQVDYEAELAVVIGKPAKNVSREDAPDYVLGYTAGNDVSARRWQKHGGGGQWVRGKSFDTFCPLGPELLTGDEIPDPQTLSIQSLLNGEIMQNGHTSDMIFSVADLIAFLSEDTTLVPGTVIMTGTPSGVGFVRKPPVYLRPGDEISVVAEKIGRLTNTVVAG